MKKIFKVLKKFLNPELKIKTIEDKNNKLVKIIIRDFIEECSINYIYWQLHLIETFTENDKIIIKITLGRPGLFIGKGGKDIKNIETYLQKRLNKNIEIKLIEFDALD